MVDPGIAGEATSAQPKTRNYADFTSFRRWLAALLEPRLRGEANER